MLSSAVRRLLDCTELNLDEIEPETVNRIIEVEQALDTDHRLDELENTVVYIGEQVELIRITLEALCQHVTMLTDRKRQKALFPESGG